MSTITFLNPAYLGALALAAVPILIHLIRRRRVRVLPWAAWDFLLQSKRRNRRRLRLEQLLLLLLRIAIVCLVVLAFCRPLLRSLGLPLVAADARIHTLIVLDNSFSMGYRAGGVTDFERARRVADDLLTRVVRQGDSVSLALLSSKPEALIKEPTFDIAKTRERVRAARVSDRDTDYGAGAALCAALLKKVRTPTKEVYWITDSQKAGLADSGSERAKNAWKELANEGRVTWIDVAGPNRENVSVETPVFSRELITPQAPVRIESVVHNYSPRARNDLLINLTVDGRASGSARVNVPANGTAKASFVYLFDKPGPHIGTVELAQPDSLARDNTAYFAARVRDKLKVLILNPKPGSDPTHDEAFYIATALAPESASEGGTTAILPTIHTGPGLSGENLRNYDAVVITGLTDIDPTERAALEDFVRNGGGLLLFPGPGADSTRVNAAFGAEGRMSLLPARLGARRITSEDSALALNAASVAHPALAAFRDTSDVDLGSARFTTTYDLIPPANDETVRVMARFSGGQPAFIERRFGQGKTILAASTAGVSGNNLPYKPAYVPLVHQIVAYLAAGPTAQHNLALGDAFTARFDVRDANKPIRLTDPAGHTSIQRSTLGADGAVFRTADTGAVGIYKLALGDQAVDAFAVELPAGESDLTPASETAIRSALGISRLQFARGTDDLLSVVRRSRRGTEIWRGLVFAVLPLLFIEALLAQRFGRRG